MPPPFCTRMLPVRELRRQVRNSHERDDSAVRLPRPCAQVVWLGTASSNQAPRQGCRAAIRGWRSTAEGPLPPAAAGSVSASAWPHLGGHLPGRAPPSGSWCRRPRSSWTGCGGSPATATTGIRRLALPPACPPHAGGSRRELTHAPAITAHLFPLPFWQGGDALLQLQQRRALHERHDQQTRRDEAGDAAGHRQQDARAGACQAAQSCGPG